MCGASGRRTARTRGAALVLALIGLGSGPAAAQESSDPTERAEAATPREFGLWGRLMVEHSRIGSAQVDEAGLRDEGLSTRVVRTEQQPRSAWGTRGDFGYALGVNRGFGVVPHVTVSVATTGYQTSTAEILGVEQRWRSRAWWWSAGFGADLQLLRRVLLLSGHAGVAGVTVEADPVSPDGLVVDSEGTTGGAVGIGIGARIPVGQHLGLGAMAGVEGFWWLFQAAAGRSVVSLFVDWDEGRR